MPRFVLAAVAMIALFPATTFAHKFWLLPSQTIFSGNESLVTVDAAISNDLFYFNHHALPLDNLVIAAPDGSQVEAQNAATLKYRSVFDVPLSQQGTYRIGVVNDGLFASWEADGRRRRWRGTAEEFKTEVPENATNLRVAESISRVETFVTNGAPTDPAGKTSDRGIVMIPVTHPNDLYAGESARFRFLLDGKPAVGLEVVAIKGGTRYRDAQDEMKLTTDSNGEVAISWSEPGMYWMEASSSDDKTTFPQASTRYLTYVATLEVLPQ